MSNSSPNSESPWRRYAPVAPLKMNKIFDKSSGVPVSPCPGPITIAAAHDQRRRISGSAVGLPCTSPSQASSYSSESRRGSAYEDIDENAIDDEDGGRSYPTSPLIRRMSLGAQAIRSARGSTSPGAPGEGTCFSFSEQFRNRAESSVSQSQRPSLSSTRYTGPAHHRAASIATMPTPLSAVAPPVPTQSYQRPPDEFQERMLKGHFYMD